MREELHLLGERIAEQAVYLDAATYRLLADLQSFDAARGWATQGFASCAPWLSWRVGWDRGTAGDRLRVANKLPTLPKVAAKLEAGELSYSKARAIARVATPATEEVLLRYAEHLPAAQLQRICAKVKIVEDGKRALLAKAQGLPLPPPPERTVQVRGLDDGMVAVRAVLRAEEAALLIEVIQRAAKQGTAPPREDVAPCCDEEGVEHGAACCSDDADDPAHVAPTAHVAPARTTYAPGELPRSRADGLMTVIQDYARGASPARSPVELIVTVPVAVLSSGALTPPPAQPPPMRQRRRRRHHPRLAERLSDATGARPFARPQRGARGPRAASAPPHPTFTAWRRRAGPGTPRRRDCRRGDGSWCQSQRRSCAA
jgi:hypothetical protein